MTISTQSICSFCNNLCIVPTQIISFDCWNPLQLNCHSIRRFCFTCVHKYLSSSLTCSFCNSNKNSLSHNIIVDFRLITLDTNQYNCPHMNCSFIGSQSQLYTHLQNCPFSTIICDGCHHEYLHINTLEHKKNCTAYHFCRICNSYILHSHMNDHNFKFHNLINCIVCNELITDDCKKSHIFNHLHENYQNYLHLTHIFENMN